MVTGSHSARDYKEAGSSVRTGRKCSPCVIINESVGEVLRSQEADTNPPGGQAFPGTRRS